MARPRKKKTSDFQTDMIKSVHLTAWPNADERDLIAHWQEVYTKEVNRMISVLCLSASDSKDASVQKKKEEAILHDVVCSTSRSTEMRALEMELRNKEDGISATFSQSAFDEAFTKAQIRMSSIRYDVIKVVPCCLTISKSLFALTLLGRTRDEMAAFLNELTANAEKPRKEWTDWVKELSTMKDFELAVSDVLVAYEAIRHEYAVPYVKKAHVRLVSTNFRFSYEKTGDPKGVIDISFPGTKGYTSFPLTMSLDGRRRFNQYGPCHSAEFTLRKTGELAVTIAFKKNITEPEAASFVGCDVGIIDTIHTSKGDAFGSFRELLHEYKTVLEPCLQEKTKQVNKKRKLKKYLRKHTLPPAVKKAIRDKIDRLEKNIRGMKKLKRLRNRYHGNLKKITKDAVDEYIASLNGDRSVGTAIEWLDIKSFDKGKKANQRFSLFARGALTEKLMTELNWHGYVFKQVDPAYTSKSCPVCSYISNGNRKGKSFKCQYCGYTNDADEVGSINIKARAQDTELMSLFENTRMTRKEKKDGIKLILDKRHQEWLKQTKTA